MAETLLLLKMLRCRRMRCEDTSVEDDVTSESSSPKCSLSIFNKSYKTEKETNVCRVCLNEGTIPIYGNNLLEDISEALNTFGGIDVTIDDPYPKYLCDNCKSLLQGAITFRKNAQQSDEILKKADTEDIPDDNDYTLSDKIEESANFLDTLTKRRPKRCKEHYCKKCNIWFDTINDLEVHKLSEEHENKKHVCSYCFKTYNTLKSLKRHLIIHTREPCYVCDLCGKKFIVKSQFSRHRSIHFYELPYKCSICPYKGRCRAALRMHMRSHTGEKPYPCTLCPAKFISKSNLNRHVLRHKKEADFQCDTCVKRFYSKGELDLHYKVEHTGVLEHICLVCNKAFGYRKQLRKHERLVHKRAKLRSGIMPVYLKVQNMEQQGEDIVTES